MSQAFRPCSECGGEQLFERHHGIPGDCPDSPDGEWPEWLGQIKSIIYTIRDKFLEVWRALCQCWEELADKLSSGAVSVQTTNIGQQITAPEMREPVLEGMT